MADDDYKNYRDYELVALKRDLEEIMREKSHEADSGFFNSTEAWRESDQYQARRVAKQVDDQIREIEQVLTARRERRQPKTEQHVQTRGFNPPTIACSSLTSGHLEVFAVDVSGGLRHRWYWSGGNWSGWQGIPAPAAGRVIAVAAGSHSDRHQELVAVAADGSVHHRWNFLGQDESWWSDWHPMPALGSAAVSVACSSLTSGHLEVFAVDVSGGLRHRWYWSGGNWSGWQGIPAPAAGRVIAVAAGSHSDRHQELVAVAADGSVHHRWNFLGQDESWWSDWHPMA